MGFRREQYKESVRQWEADHKINVLKALQSSKVIRSTGTKTTSSSKGTKTPVSKEYVIKRGLALGVDEEDLNERISAYGVDAVNGGLDYATEYADSRKNTPNQQDTASFFRDLPFALIQEGTTTNLNDALEEMGYESGYLEEYIGDGIVTTPAVYGHIETPFADPMTPDARKKISDAQTIEALGIINNIIATLPTGGDTEGRNRATTMANILESGGDQAFGRIAQLLTPEEKQRVWTAITEVHPEVGSAFALFEPPATPDQFPEPGDLRFEGVGPAEMPSTPPLKWGDSHWFPDKEAYAAATKADPTLIEDGSKVVIGTQTIEHKQGTEHVFDSPEEVQAFLKKNPGKIKLGDLITIGGVTKPVIALPSEPIPRSENLRGRNKTKTQTPVELKPQSTESPTRRGTRPFVERPVDETEKALREEVKKAERAYNLDWSHGKKGNPERLKKLEEARANLAKYLEDGSGEEENKQNKSRKRTK